MRDYPGSPRIDSKMLNDCSAQCANSTALGHPQKGIRDEIAEKRDKSAISCDEMKRRETALERVSAWRIRRQLKWKRGFLMTTGSIKSTSLPKPHRSQNVRLPQSASRHCSWNAAFRPLRCARGRRQFDFPGGLRTVKRRKRRAQGGLPIKNSVKMRPDSKGRSRVGGNPAVCGGCSTPAAQTQAACKSLLHGE